MGFYFRDDVGIPGGPMSWQAGGRTPTHKENGQSQRQLRPTQFLGGICPCTLPVGLHLSCMPGALKDKWGNGVLFV